MKAYRMVFYYFTKCLQYIYIYGIGPVPCSHEGGAGLGARMPRSNSSRAVGHACTPAHPPLLIRLTNTSMFMEGAEVIQLPIEGSLTIPKAIIKGVYLGMVTAAPLSTGAPRIGRGEQRALQTACGYALFCRHF